MSCTSTIRNKADGRRGGLLAGNRGSAILLVVSVGALVTLMVFTWVAFSVRRSHTAIDMRDVLRARYAAESVVSTAIYGRMLHPEGRTAADTITEVVRSGDSTATPVDSSLVYVDFLHRSQASATLTDEGSYVRVAANGNSGRASCAIDALFGQELPDAFRYALVLAEQNKQLDARRGTIIGDINVVKEPLGTIRGKTDVGAIAAQLPQVAEEKITGEMKKLESKISFPEKSETVLQGSQVFDARSLPALDSGKDLFVNGSVIIESGAGKPSVIKGTGAVIASGNIQISGSMTFEGTTFIALGDVIVTGNVRLDKVTIYSQGAIDFEDEVRCAGNLYAFQTIMLIDRAAIELPSFAYIRGVESNDPKKSMLGLQLMQRSRFSGVLFCAKGATYSIVEREARFTGLLFTRGYVVLQGTVFGCVAASRLAEKIMDDRNALAGGTINRSMLPKSFTVPLAFGRQGAAFTVVSWDESFALPKGKEE
jgi:hypothetical protein